MTFYIPQFWCGVIATIIFEICMLIGAVIVSTLGKDEKKGENDVKEEAGGLVGTYDDRGEWDNSQCGGN